MTKTIKNKRKGYRCTPDRSVNWSMIRRAYDKAWKSGAHTAPPIPASLNAPQETVDAMGSVLAYVNEPAPLTKTPLIPLDDRPGNDVDLVLMDEMAPMPVTLRDTEPKRDQYDELALYVEDLAKHYGVIVRGNRIAGLSMANVVDPEPLNNGRTIRVIDMSFDNADKRITRVRVFRHSVIEPTYTITTDKLGWVEAAIRGSA